MHKVFSKELQKVTPFLQPEVQGLCAHQMIIAALDVRGNNQILSF